MAKIFDIIGSDFIDDQLGDGFVILLLPEFYPLSPLITQKFVQARNLNEALIRGKHYFLVTDEISRGFLLGFLSLKIPFSKIYSDRPDVICKYINSLPIYSSRTTDQRYEENKEQGIDENVDRLPVSNSEQFSSTISNQISYRMGQEHQPGFSYDPSQNYSHTEISNLKYKGQGLSSQFPFDTSQVSRNMNTSAHHSNLDSLSFKEIPQNQDYSINSKSFSEREQVPGQTNSSERGQLPGQINTSERGQLPGQINSSERGQLPGQTNSSERGQLPGQINTSERGQLPGQINSSERGQLPGQTSSSERGQLPGQINTSERGQLPGQINTSERGQLPGQTVYPEQRQFYSKPTSSHHGQLPGNGLPNQRNLAGTFLPKSDNYLGNTLEFPHQSLQQPNPKFYTRPDEASRRAKLEKAYREALNNITIKLAYPQKEVIQKNRLIKQLKSCASSSLERAKKKPGENPREEEVVGCLIEDLIANRIIEDSDPVFIINTKAAQECLIDGIREFVSMFEIKREVINTREICRDVNFFLESRRSITTIELFQYIVNLLRNTCKSLSESELKPKSKIILQKVIQTNNLKFNGVTLDELVNDPMKYSTVLLDN